MFFITLFYFETLQTLNRTARRVSYTIVFKSVQNYFPQALSFPPFYGEHWLGWTRAKIGQIDIVLLSNHNIERRESQSSAFPIGTLWQHSSCACE